MTQQFVKLVTFLLREAGVEYGNHGCNDFDLSKHLTRQQQLEFVTLAHKYNGDPEETERAIENLPYFADFAAMFACASILENYEDTVSL